MNLTRLFLLLASTTVISCSGSTKTTGSASDDSGGTTCTYCGWAISVQLIQTLNGTCSFNDCGHGSHGACGLSALMDLQEPSSGQIKLDPMIPGLLRGLYFEGTIDTSTGQINTTHSAFASSTLLAGWDLVNNTIGGQIYWKPNATCEAVIDFTGTPRS